ncbi:MAG: tail fiber domain-containing protein [Candidatus Desulfacyla sp.]
MGFYTDATKLASTSMGAGTTASGIFATAMGFETTAEGENSTAMGKYTRSSGYASTTLGVSTKASGYASIASGYDTNAAGLYSFAGGYGIQLTADADNTFAWGHDEDKTLISIPDAFLIFPAGTPGKVGIGTKDPQRIMHVVGVNPRILIEASSSNAEVNFKNSGDSNGVIWSVYKDGSNHNLNFYQGGNKVTIQSLTGNVGIGTVNPGYKLEVNGSAAKPDGGFWSNSSDERLKDITGAYTLGLDEIVRLRPITFHYKENNPRGLPSKDEYIGFIAQEVQEVFPEAVSEGPDGYLDFNMHPVNVALVNAVKELKAENETLKQEIQQIKAALGM